MPPDAELEPNGMDSVSETANEGNPSWQEIYDILPQGYEALVAPHLDKWDKSTQAKFQANAEAQLVYEPYKQFVDNEIGSDQIEQALNIAQMIDSDPKAFMEQMRTFFGEDTGQDQSTPPEPDEDEDFVKPYDLTTDKNFQKMMEQQDTIAGFLAQQVETERAGKEDIALEAELGKLTKTYGAFDEDYVFGLALNDVPLEDAVKKYHAMVEGIRSKPAADSGLPNILTPGGGLPSEHINPADMDKKQRMAYMVHALENASKT